MGLLDLLGLGGGRSSEKAMAKNITRLTNQNVQHEDRLRAAELLAQMNTEESLFGLLKRFDMKLDKDYQDLDEKVFVRDLLVEKGQTAILPIRRFLKASDNVNWPERILSTILNDDQAVITTLLEVIDEERDSGDMKGPKRAKLLSLLVKYEDPRIPQAMLSFLGDFDETVRFTAIEVLDTQGDVTCREPLMEVLLGTAEESQRVRRRILEAFAKHGWSIAAWVDRLEPLLSEGFAVKGDKVIEVSA